MLVFYINSTNNRFRPFFRIFISKMFFSKQIFLVFQFKKCVFCFLFQISKYVSSTKDTQLNPANIYGLTFLSRIHVCLSEIFLNQKAERIFWKSFRTSQVEKMSMTPLLLGNKRKTLGVDLDFEGLFKRV